MRIALLSDLHGNLPALEAVLAVLARESIDQMVCLGDVAMFGPQPREVLTRVQALGCPVVMGNTDAWALAPQPHPIRNEVTEFFNAIELWGAAQLTEADRAYIRTFQATVSIALGCGCDENRSFPSGITQETNAGFHSELRIDDEVTLLCYHGSPRSYHDLLVATTPDIELAALIGTQAARFLAGGHTHAQYVRRYQDKLLLNPGSVGLPYETLTDSTDRNPPWAEYAIIEWISGELTVALRRTPYAVEPLLAAAKASGMPHTEWWSKDWR